MIYAVVDDEKVIVAGKTMLVYEMHVPLLSCQADLVAALDEAGEGLFASITACGYQRVVVLRDVQGQKMISRKVLPTFEAAINVKLLVVDLVLL